MTTFKPIPHLLLPFLLFVSISLFGQHSLRMPSNPFLEKFSSEDAIQSIDFDLSASRIAIAARNSIEVSSLYTEGEVLKLRGHRGNINHLAFSNDGKRLAAGSWDNTVRIWNLENGRRQHNLAVHYNAVSVISWSPDDTHIASGSWDAGIRIFNSKNGQLERQMLGHNGYISALTYSQDGKLLVSAGFDRKVIIWNAALGSAVQLIDGLDNTILGLAFSDDGRFVAGGDSEGNLLVWNVEDGSLAYSYPDVFQAHHHVYFDFGGQAYTITKNGKSHIHWNNFWQYQGNEELAERIPGLAIRLKPQSQFETGLEYFKRASGSSKTLGNLIIIRDQEEKQKRLQAIAMSRKPVVLPPTDVILGAYDLSEGVYELNIQGKSTKLYIDRDAARQLYENSEVLRVEAIEQLSENMLYKQFINLVLVHPITGYRYPLGEQLALEEHAAPASLPAKLVVSEASFTDSDGDNRLSAGERAVIQLTVTNHGPGTAQLVRIIGSSEADIKGLSASLGNIEPSESKTVSLTITGGDKLENSNVEIQLSTLEINGFHADPLHMIVPTRSFKAPKLKIADVGVEDAEGRTTITPGTVVNITVRLHNAGEGHAEEVRARITPGQGVFLAATPNPIYALIDGGALAPGAYKDITFQAFANSEAEGFPIEVELMEASGKYGHFQSNLGLSLFRAQRSVHELVVSAKKLENTFEAASGLSSDIASNIPMSELINNDAVAVIIGNRSYQAGTPQVAYALNDAMLTRRYVEQALGYRPGNILYLEDATLTNMKVLFGDRNLPKGRIHDLVKPGISDVFVFYSGHGAPDPNERKAYLMPIDADPSRLNLTGYSLEVLYDNLSKLEARSITVVLDACFSGATGGGDMLIAQASPIGIRVNDPSAILGENAVVISASSGQQIASWYPEMRHGLLTYFFLKGLQGSADRDQDGEVTAGEMALWLSDGSDGIPYMARRLHSREQTPQVWGNINMVLR